MAPGVFTPLLQAAVISALLLGFALGVNQQMVLPRQERELGVVRRSAGPPSVRRYADCDPHLYTLLRRERGELRASARSIPESAELR